MEGKIFKYHGRYYYVQCFQFRQGSPDEDLGAIVFDVTGLPDTSKIKEVGRILAPNSAIASGPAGHCAGTAGCSLPGGFHNVFPYRHSDGLGVLSLMVRVGLRCHVARQGYGRAIEHRDPPERFARHPARPPALSRRARAPPVWCQDARPRTRPAASDGDLWIASAAWRICGQSVGVPGPPTA